MSYAIPTLPLSKSNINGTPGTTTVGHWSDIDANQLSASHVAVVGYVNSVSGGLTTLSGAYVSLSSSYVDLSNSFTVVSGWVAEEQAEHGSEMVSVTASIQFAKMLLGCDLAQVPVSTGSHPTASYNNMREAFYALTAAFSASASVWNTASTYVSNSASYWDATYLWYQSTMTSMAYLTSSHWNPSGGTYYITGSISASSTGKVSGSFEITGSSATTLYLHSPDGNRWAITVDNAGVLSSTLA